MFDGDLTNISAQTKLLIRALTEHMGDAHRDFVFQIDKLWFGYFDPVHIISKNENNIFLGWPNRHIGRNKFTTDHQQACC